LAGNALKQGAESEGWRGNAHSALDPRVGRDTESRRSPSRRSRWAEGPREGSDFPYAGEGVGGGIAGPVRPGSPDRCAFSTPSQMVRSCGRGERRKQREGACPCGRAKRRRRSRWERATLSVARVSVTRGVAAGYAGAGGSPQGSDRSLAGAQKRQCDEAARWFYQTRTLRRNTTRIDP
jgi:hypothetical protein